MGKLAEARKSETVSLLQRLVQIPSYSLEEGTADDPETAVGVLWRALADHGSEKSRQTVGPKSENLIEVIGNGSSRTFVLEAHIDVVPEGDPSRWFDGQPFSGAIGAVRYLGDSSVEISVGTDREVRRIRDRMARIWENHRRYAERSIVYGRGSFDNKGAVVSLATAMAVVEDVLKETSRNISGRIVAAYTADEESDATGVRRFASDADSWLATNGYLAGDVDAAGFLKSTCGIALDGSYGWIPVIGHRGAIQLELTTFGQSAHASTPDLGVNAVLGMSSLLQAVAKGENEIMERVAGLLDSDLLGQLTIAIGTTIVGGGVTRVSQDQGAMVVARAGVNAVPAWCQATFDVRFPPGRNYPFDVEASYDAVRDAVDTVLASRAEGEPWRYELKTIVGSLTPPVAIAPTVDLAANHPLVELARTQSARVLGYQPPIETAPGGTDATFMVHGAHIPTLVELGPAGGLSHDTHEFVEIDDVIDGAKILALIALSANGVVEL